MARRIYGNRWKTIGSLGEGGQSFVYRVCDTTKAEGGEWALKRLKELDRVERFRREVEILRRHPHENIVPLIDAQIKEHGNEADNYLVMPIAAHGDLRKRIAIYQGHIGSVIQVVLQIARALDFIHAANVVHRDIKPGNILFPEAGHKVWVADFGLAFDPDATWASPVGEVIGPRGFTAPELETGDPGKAAPSADVYSLGRLIFYMLSGGRHINRDNVFHPDHDSVFAKSERYTDLRLLLHRMVAEQVTRIAQMKEVVTELERLEKWEENAVSILLSQTSRAAVDQLKRRTAETLGIRAENTAARKSEEALMQAVTTAMENWLEAELAKLSDHISANGAIRAWVTRETVPNVDRFYVETGMRAAIKALGGMALGIELLSDLFHHEYKLNILIGNEQTVTIGAAETRSPARDPSLVAIPIFTQTHPEHRDRIQFVAYFLGAPVRHGVPDPTRPIRQVTSATPFQQAQLHQTFHDGFTRILRFKASEWPAAEDELPQMIDAAFQQVLQHIASPYKALGP